MSGRKQIWADDDFIKEAKKASEEFGLSMRQTTKMFAKALREGSSRVVVKNGKKGKVLEYELPKFKIM